MSYCRLCDAPAPASLPTPSGSRSWPSALDAESPDPQCVRCGPHLCPRVAGHGGSVDGESTRLGRGPGAPHLWASGAVGPSVLRRTVAAVNVLVGTAPGVRLHSHVTCSEHPPPLPGGAGLGWRWIHVAPVPLRNVNSDRAACQLPPTREVAGRSGSEGTRGEAGGGGEERTRQARKGGAGDSWGGSGLAPGSRRAPRPRMALPASVGTGTDWHVASDQSVRGGGDSPFPDA